mgnify:FL=1
MFKKKFKKSKPSLLKSFYYAFQGIKVNILTERNLAIHFCVMLLVIVCGFTFKISTTEWLICILLFGFVITLELMNTAIETAIDICKPEINPKAKLAKDTAAGAVLVVAIVAVVVGIIIFGPKIINVICR